MATSADIISLDERAEQLRQEHGDSVAVNDIANVVTSLVAGTSHDDELDKVASELKDLLQFIDAAKHELVGMQPKSLSNRDIPDANVELDAVIKASEDAASTIMDVADILGEVAENVDDVSATKLNDAAGELFQASSFQDLTGQRITKVNVTLSHLEQRLNALAEAIGDDFIEASAEDIELDAQGVAVNDEDLLHGPQLEGEGNSQDEIDAILAAFD